MSNVDQGPRVSTDVIAASPVMDSYNVFAATAVRQQAVDPVITELVRLRCATVHDCRFCGSVRLIDARDAGLDESMVVKIADYENADFDPRWKAALRLTDAMILTPGDIDEDLRAEVDAHFSAEEVSELLFDVMKWSLQKSLVALRVEPPSSDGNSDMAFDERGEAVFYAASSG